MAMAMAFIGLCIAAACAVVATAVVIDGGSIWAVPICAVCGSAAAFCAGLWIREDA